MIFQETPLRGAYWIDLNPIQDQRGFFARSYCRVEFQKQGLAPCDVQGSLSFNQRRGTLRGMHYQSAPCAEAKVVRCMRGALYDVIIDLRPTSPSYCRWISTELSEKNYRALYIPEGFAHGFQTMRDETVVAYQMSVPFSPEHARGVRWDDPAFAIRWGLPICEISEKDRNYPDFVP